MASAKKIFLGDLCTIIDCEHKTAPTEETRIPLIRTPNIGCGRLILNDVQRISERTFKLWTRRGEPKEGDLIMAREAPVGNVAIVHANERVCLGQRTVLIRVKDECVVAAYLNYVLNSPAMNTYLNLISNGATVGHLNVTDIRRLSLPALPPKSGQKKIAAILSTYDELIENNQRRIALLEEMAEEIYREWFVRMRFSGHEKKRVIKGLPEGWKLVKLENAFRFTGGGTPTKEVNRYWDDGDVNWFTPSDITASDGIFLERSGEQCTEEGFNNSSAKMFPAYSVMLTSRATIGVVGINLTPACTNQGFITCIPNAQYPLPYLYHWIKLAKPHFELLSGGATFAELTKGTFKRIEILTPPESIITEFARIESPLFKVIESHLRANNKLIETRDKLLPRLISGKLSVEHLDIQFPPGMEDRP